MKATIITLENETGVYEHLKVIGSPEDIATIAKLISEAMGTKVERVKRWDIDKEDWAVKTGKIERMHDLLTELDEELIEVGGGVRNLSRIL